MIYYSNNNLVDYIESNIEHKDETFNNNIINILTKIFIYDILYNKEADHNTKYSFGKLKKTAKKTDKSIAPLPYKKLKYIRNLNKIVIFEQRTLIYHISK